jgi:hypothetical protein
MITTTWMMLLLIILFFEIRTYDEVYDAEDNDNNTSLPVSSPSNNTENNSFIGNIANVTVTYAQAVRQRNRQLMDNMYVGSVQLERYGDMAYRRYVLQDSSLGDREGHGYYGGHSQGYIQRRATDTQSSLEGYHA